MRTRTLALAFLPALLPLLAPAAASAARPAQVAWVASNQIRVIDLDRGEVVGRIPLQEYVHDIVFTPDGARAAVASSGGLRLADADGLAFTTRLTDRPAVAAAVDAARGAVVAVVNPYSDEALRARNEGRPAPSPEVMSWDLSTGARRVAWAVPGMPIDLAVDGARDRVYVLEALAGRVLVFDGSGRALDSIAVSEKAERYMFSRMRLSEDGARLVVPRTDADQTVLAEVHPLSPAGAADRVRFQRLGEARRVSDVAFGRDGQVFLSSLRTVARVPGRGGEPTWERFDLAWAGMATVPSTGNLVLIAPTLDPEVGSGGVTLADPEGKVIRSVELVDISPFTVAVRPAAAR